MPPKGTETFSVREGYSNPPPQIAHGQMSSKFIAHTWAVIFNHFDSCLSKNGKRAYRVNEPWHTWLLVWFVKNDEGFADEFPERVAEIQQYLKEIITESQLPCLFDFLEFIMCDESASDPLVQAITDAFEQNRMAYRVMDGRIFPITSEQNAEAISGAVRKASSSGAHGVKRHLSNASEELRDGQWAASVREAIHAIEAAAKYVEPDASELNDALRKLEKSGKLRHPALKQALTKLYAYASDEKGVRHSLVLDDKSAVTETEALFMFGTCAAFVDYLLTHADHET